MRSGSGHGGILVIAAVLASGWILAACSAGGTPASTPLQMTIEPDVATVVAGTPQVFVATVAEPASPALTWSVEEGSVGGDISPTGVYRAPNRTGTYHIVAASGADSSSRGRATVTVVPSPVISVSITSPANPAVILPPGGTVAFLAAVNGAGNRNVTWTIETGRPVPGGAITVEGVYSAPALELVRPYLDAGGSITVVVRARSVADLSKSATRPVVIQLQPSPATISPPGVVVGLGEVVTLVLSEALSQGTTWTVNDLAGGHSEVGTISGYGVYKAPFQLPDFPTVVVGSSAATNRVSVAVVRRFLPPETLPVHACLPSCPFARPAALAAADFNGDGLSDLATANPGSGTVSLLIAADSSHFATPYRLSAGAPEVSGPRTLLATLLNGDGLADFVTASADVTGGVVRTRLGVGDGTFGGEGASDWPGSADPVAVAAGAFDGDAIPDLLVTDAAASVLQLFQGLGSGLFSLRASLADAARIPRLTAAVVADFDGSGQDDLAVAPGDNTVSVWLANQDGSFRNAQTITFQPGYVPVAMLAVDLNVDAAPDLVVMSGTTSAVSVVLNSPVPSNGLFGAPSPSIEAGLRPAALATGDFNKDGLPDVVVADGHADTVTTFFGDDAGALVRSETYVIGVVPDAVTTGDFNGDGWDDVAVTNSDDDTVSVLRNRGGPTSP